MLQPLDAKPPEARIQGCAPHGWNAPARIRATAAIQRIRCTIKVLRIRLWVDARPRTQPPEHTKKGRGGFPALAPSFELEVLPYEPVAWNVKLTSAVGESPTVIVCVFVPYFSCHASIVYCPAGRSAILKLPSAALTA